MPLIIAADIHVAKLWDPLAELIGEAAEFVNPNALLRELVARVKRDDLLILDGDLVDYHDAAYDGGPETNTDLLDELLRPCKGAIACNAGNHDYRKLGYNNRFYSFWHMNLPRPACIPYADAFGLRRVRGLKELDSIRARAVPTAGKKRIPELQIVRRDEGEIILASTGPDAFTSLTNIPWLLRHRQLFADPPVSRGLTDETFAQVSARLMADGGTLFLALHAPPFFATEPFPALPLTQEFPERLERYGGRHTCFKDYRDEFLEAVSASPRNVHIITGHTHHPLQFLIDKEKKTVRSCSIQETNACRDDPRYVKMVCAPPLGAIVPPYNRTVGYLSYGPEGYALHELRTYNEGKKEKGT